MPFLNIEANALLLKWAVALGIFILFVILSLASRFILERVIALLTHHTKTRLDKLIIKALTRPVSLALIALGLRLSISKISELDEFTPQIDKFFSAVYIALVAVALVRVINAPLRWYNLKVASRTRTDLDNKLVPILRRTSSIIIYGIAIMIIIDQYTEITPLLAGLGVGGLAVALALQSTLSNFFAGTYVMSDAIIHQGDYIMLDSGHEGFVEGIGWRSTRIRDWRGNLIILPNSKLAEAIVTDFEAPDKSMLFTVDCGVSYDSDLEKVERITIDVAEAVINRQPEGSKDFKPLIRFKEFGDSNINFAVVMKSVDRVGHFILKHEFIKALHKRFREEGIEIQYPARKLYIDGLEAALPTAAILKKAARTRNES